MTNDQRDNFFRIRCLGRQGIPITITEENFVIDMRKEFPDQCKELDDKAYDKTKPFGAW